MVAEVLEERVALSAVPFSPLDKLVANDAGAGDQFGFSVAASFDGETLVVGSRQDDNSFTLDSGSAYVSRWD